MTNDRGQGCGWKIGRRALEALALAGALALLQGCGAKEQAADLFCPAPAAVGLAGAFVLASWLAMIRRA